MELNKYLPIGSIIKIKNGKQLFMIVGYLIKHQNKIYDYSACCFPEGILSLNEIITFNHDKIATVLYKGYQNDDYNKLNEIIKNINK